MHRLIQKPLLLLLLIALNFYPVESVLAESDNTQKRLVFGIAPFMSPIALVKRMAPLRDYLSNSLGVPVLIETTTDAREFSRRTLAGKYDFVLTNPTFSLMAMDQGNFQIIASQKKKLTGHFVVMQNSHISDIKHLKNKRVGCPPKVGFMGQLISPYLSNNIFKAEEMPEITYFHSHNDAISSLRLGNIDATLIVSFMEKHLLSKNVPIRTIHKTADYPGMTIVADNKLQPKLIKKLRQSLFQLDNTAAGKKVLGQISMSGYQPIDIEELETVRPYIPESDL